jgi:uncharacterized protein YraI
MSNIRMRVRGRAPLVFCASVLALAVSGGAFAQEPAQTTSNVNLRGGPGTDHPVVMAMPEGAQVQVLQCPAPGAWCELDYRGTVGWASARFLTVDTAATGAAQQRQRRTAPISPESTMGGY